MHHGYKINTSHVLSSYMNTHTYTHHYREAGYLYSVGELFTCCDGLKHHNMSTMQCVMYMFIHGESTWL